MSSILQRTSRLLKIRFTQFAPLRAALSSSAFIANKLFDRHVKASYSEAGEDRLLATLMGNVESGYYVDVGCNDPIFYSNTYLLYQKGWRGLAIDANADLVRRFARVRPRDTCVHYAVALKSGKMDLHVSDDPLMSTTDDRFAREKLGMNRVLRVESVRAAPLATIFQENNVPVGFDVLSIDIEGSDLVALNTADLDYYKPRWILVEDLGIDVAKPDTSETVRMLEGKHYVLVATTHRNLFFRRVT